MKRFSGALIALAVLVIIGGVWGAYVALNQPPPEVDETPQIFSFEKEDLVGITLERKDTTIAFELGDDGEWNWVDSSWRPSSSMVKRVAHQSHDLAARATVAQAEDLAEYGFGDEPITVTLDLRGDEQIRFQAGDPNPTSVSWYVRPLPGDTVYVVKKSAVDYWRMDVEDFREKRFAGFEADDAVAIDATVDGRRLVFRRVDAEKWQQTEPVQQRADRQKVRTMLGRTSALKAWAFVEDHPEDLSRYGLAEPKHTVQITRSEGETITLHVGDVIVGTEPQERYVLRVEDDAVYQTRDGFLEAFLETDQEYRDTRILYVESDEIVDYTVYSERFEPITVTRTPDGWRWPDGAQISGATPRRVAREATDPTALEFIDEPEDGKDYGLDDAERRVVVKRQGAEPLQVVLGERFGVVDAETGREHDRYYLRVEGDPVVYVVSGALHDELDALLNEYRRKLETDEEKGLLQGDTDTDADGE